jgi:putative inorganic carbon (HCO3(-)) transporter
LLENPNTLGVYLLLVYPIAIAQLMVTRKKKIKLLYFIMLCSIITCSIMTWSRGTWLGMIAATVIFMLVYNFRTIWLLIFGGGLIPVFVMLYQKFFADIEFINPVLTRLGSIFNFTNPDTSMQLRPTIWGKTWELISRNWITGIGVGEQAFRMEFINVATQDIVWAAHSHNLYLQIFLELGIVGIIIFGLILFAYHQKCFSNVKSRNQKSRARTMICGGYASIFGLCVMGLTDHVWYNTRVFLMSWIIIALTIALTKTNEAEKESDRIVNNMRSVDIEIG